MFNISEVFEIAEQIERNGYEFYSRAAQIAADDDQKDFLSALAKMEQEHESLFGSMKQKYCSRAVYPETADLDDTALGYLQAMVDGDIFINIRPVDDILTGSETVQDIKRLAVEFEKNTVVYFTSLKNVLADSGDAERVDELIKEELKHISILLNWQPDCKI